MNHSPKQSRNEFCLCGSGLKYKKCCGGETPAPFDVAAIGDLDWQRIRRTEGVLIDKHLLPYVLKNFIPEMMELAWDDFMKMSPDLDLDEEDVGHLHYQLFLPWFLFDWTPVSLNQLCVHTRKTEGEEPEPMVSIAQTYLKQHGHMLSSYEREFLETMDKTYHSFYQILEVVPDQRLHVRDILLQTEHVLKEKSGTHCLKVGNLIFFRILSLKEQSIGIGWGPCIVLFHHLLPLLKLREEWEDQLQHPLTAENLRGEYAEFLRFLYLEWSYSEQELELELERVFNAVN